MGYPYDGALVPVSEASLSSEMPGLVSRASVDGTPEESTIAERCRCARHIARGGAAGTAIQ